MTDAATDPTTDIKQAHRAMWALGDYASVAELIDDVARDYMAFLEERHGPTRLARVLKS